MVTGYVTIALGLCGFAIWAALTEVAGAVIAPGAVEVEARRQVIQHPDGGRIAAILARPGDAVAAGAPILVLDDDDLRTEEAMIERQLHETQAQLDRLGSELRREETVRFRSELEAAASMDVIIATMLSDERALFATRRDALAQNAAQYAERAAQTEASIGGRQRELRALHRQMALLAQDLEAQEKLLSQGLTAATRVTAIQRQIAETEGATGALEAAIAEAKSEIASFGIERLRTETEWRETTQEELRSLQPREAELLERLRFIRAEIERRVLRAPMAGIVHDLQVFTEGGVLPPGVEVASIVPQGANLILSVRIDPAEIDRVHVGQPTIVRFPSFNARITPEFAGQLRQISADALTDPQTQLRYYSAEVLLIEALPPDLTLVPGMPVETFLQTAPRSPLSFLIKPFTDYLVLAMREE